MNSYTIEPEDLTWRAVLSRDSIGWTMLTFRVCRDDPDPVMSRHRTADEAIEQLQHWIDEDR